MINDIDRMKILTACDKAFTSTERKNIEPVWQDIADYILPTQALTFSSNGLYDSLGEDISVGQFDSTAVQANYDLAAAINSTLTSPTSVWAKLRHSDNDLNDDSEISEFMDKSGAAIMKHFADSNLYQQLHMGYQSLTSFGSMAILFEVKRDDLGKFEGFYFTNLHLSQVAWVENKEGIADTIYRKFRMTCRQILEQWGYEASPKGIQECYETDPERDFIVTHCIKPRPKKDVKYNNLGLAEPEHRPFMSVYILNETGEVLEEGGHYEMPHLVARWSTMAGEEYGRGPGHIAKADVKTLNKLTEMILEATALSVRPPMKAIMRSVMGDEVNHVPGGLTFVKSHDSIQEMVTGARIDVGQLEKEALQMSIQKVFLLDKLQLPPRTETGEMTAYEVSQRIEQMQRVLGPTLTRLNVELLQPLIIRAFRILLREGQLPEIPEALQGSDLDVDIVFVNQLARAQSTESISSILRWINELSQIAAMDPSVMDVVDMDKVAIHLGRTEGVPEVCIRSPADVEAIRQQRAEMQQQQMEAEINLKNADAQSKMQ